jgi:hypothetical protein
MSRIFHMKTETDTNLRNTALSTKGRTMDNVQNIPHEDEDRL